MKDFIQKNFPELLLTVLMGATVIVMLFAIHWHDDSTIKWCEGFIGGLAYSLTTSINSMRAAHAVTPNTTVTSTESVRVTDPNATKP